MFIASLHGVFMILLLVIVTRDNNFLDARKKTRGNNQYFNRIGGEDIMSTWNGVEEVMSTWKFGEEIMSTWKFGEEIMSTWEFGEQIMSTWEFGIQHH